jgi:multidrug efflux pump subunit AcrA (membrane-fusion protein)
VRNVAIQEGQFVRRGDALFSFDDRGDRATLDRSRAQLARDRAVLADLQRQLDRAKDLLRQGFVAQSNVDGVQAQFDAQQAAIRADEATVQASEVSLSFGAITAPLSGRAGAVSVFAGTLVQPGGPALVTISQIDPIGVSFNVPEAQLANLLRSQAQGGAGKGGGKPAGQGTDKAGTADKSGKAAAASATQAGQGAAAAASGAVGKAGKGDNKPVTAPALGTGMISVSLPSGERGRNAPPAEAWQGKVSFIDNSVDVSTGTIKVKGALANAQQQLWPGQYVTVRMTLRTLKDALVVPVAALIQRGSERSIFVVNAEGKAEQKVVQQRYVFGDSAVVDGLSLGDRIVVEGKQNLRSGTPVREVAAEAGRAASGPAIDAASGARNAASGGSGVAGGGDALAAGARP